MTEWKEYKLGEVVSIASGFAYKGEHIGKGESLLLGMGCVSYKEKFLISGARPYAGDCAERYFAKAGDIVLATRQQSDNLPILGMPAIIPEELKDKKLIVGANLYRVINNSDFDNKYLYWLLKTPSYVKHIASCKTGTTVAMITKADIENFVFVAPGKQERERILETISSLDDKIDLLRRENATLEQMAETMFRQWFVVERKEEWEEGKLGDILTVKGGTTPSTKEPSFWDGDIAWTSPRDVTTLNGLYLFKTEKKITQKGLEQISSGLLPSGTLLMSSRAPVGVLAFAEIPLAINQGYIAILDDKGYSKEFIYLWLKTNMDLVHSYSNGSTFMEISKSAFKSLDISIPSKNEVECFVQEVKPYFEKIRTNEIQIRTLTKTRDGLLPKLMSGEIKL